MKKIITIISCLILVKNASALTVTQDTICQGSGYTWNGQAYDTTGIYYFNNDTLLLMVKPSPHIYTTQTNTFCSTGTETISIWQDSNYIAITGLVYQWGQQVDTFGNITYLHAAGNYSVTATAPNGCTGEAIVTVLLCDTNNIFPGDANNDNIADNNDILAIGTAYGSSGPTRNTISIVWQGFYCADWSSQFTNGTNLKHADCNGDGVINADDTLAVVQNFGQIHGKNNERANDRSGLPYLNIVLNQDIYHNGDTLIASIQLGDAETTVNNLYGLAFNYNFDPTVLQIDSSSPAYFDYTSSWLADDTSKISIAQFSSASGIIKTAVSRIDHTNRSGSGEIARFSAIITTDNINGISRTATHYISGLRAIDNLEHNIELNEGIDSANVLKSSVGIAAIKGEIAFSLYPNPANNSVTIKGTENIEGIVITTVLGNQVFSEKNIKKTVFSADISALPSGVYIVQIQTANGKDEKRFVVTK